MSDPVAAVGPRRIILGLLLGGLLVLAYVVLQLFLVPVAWAAIMAYTTWPLYVRLRRALGGRATLSAALMSLLLMAAFVLPLLWLVAMLRTELVGAYAAVAAYLAQGPRPLPAFAAAIPGSATGFSSCWTNWPATGGAARADRPVGRTARRRPAQTAGRRRPQHRQTRLRHGDCAVPVP